jgi:FkbM family methyltransferase
MHGWDLQRFSPTNNASAQLLAVLNYTKSNVLFDIGANVGQFARESRSAGYDGKIVSFEPLSSAHDKLSKAAHNDKSWWVHSRAAVGDYDGEIDINIAGNSVSSSVLPMLEAHLSASFESAYIGVERTPMVRLDSVVAQYINGNSRPFIKIDTQGFEWQVLDGAVETLQYTKGVLLELSLVPLYDGQRLWCEMIGRMESFGLTLWSIQKGFSEKSTGRTLQIDAIFIREL